MRILRALRFLTQSLTVVFLLQTNVNAGNWNSGSSDAVDAALSNCMAVGLRNLEAVLSSNPELFIKLMGKAAIPDGFQPTSSRQRLFIKLTSKFDQPIAEEDRTAILRMIMPNCDYSLLAREGVVYCFIAEIAEEQENDLKRSLNQDVSITYSAVAEAMVGSAQIDIQQIMSRVSERELNEFRRKFERFSKNSMFNLEVQKFTHRMTDIFASYDMEYTP